MASEVISHAIFLPLPISPHPAPHCLPLRFPLHPRLPPRASLHIPPCASPSIPPELHLAPCTPLFTLLCAALLPPRIPSRPSPSTPPPPIPILIPQPSLFFLPPTHFPSAYLHPSLFLSQAPSPRIPSCPSPCAPTPFHTTHFHRTSLLPRIPLAKSLPPRHSIFLPSTHFPSASLHPPCSSAKPRLWIFSCVKRPGSLTT